MELVGGVGAAVVGSGLVVLWWGGWVLSRFGWDSLLPLSTLVWHYRVWDYAYYCEENRAG